MDYVAEALIKKMVLYIHFDHEWAQAYGFVSLWINVLRLGSDQNLNNRSDQAEIGSNDQKRKNPSLVAWSSRICKQH